MNKMLIPLLIAFSGAPWAANAATLDLSTFTLSTGTNSLGTVVSSTLATLVGTASITAQVSGLNSFEWKFTAGDIYVPEVDLNDYSYLTLSSGTAELADVHAVGVNQSTGWINYVFASPYSGNIKLGVQNRFDDEDASQLQIRNLLTVTTIPEPAGYVMLLAGMGLTGVMARRRQRGLATI